jgi:undecaprenyl-diphosphatase
MDFWYLITLLGEPTMWAFSTVILAMAYVLLRKKLAPKKKKLFKKILYIYIPGVIMTLLIVLILKNAISTERPCTPCTDGVENCNPYCGFDNSFPSGHAAAIFTVVTSLYLSLRKKQLLPLYIVSILVASSRYFLGVHRIVDIVVGAILGIVIPFIFSLVYKKDFENKA